MLILCPHCGRTLRVPLKDGLSFCSNCRQAVDCSPSNKILSAAWEIRRKGFMSSAILECLSDEEAIIVNNFVEEKDYSHDDLLIELKKLKLKI